ncbi:hypothetical protein X801_07775 [Opisthorchis viverrini]|uniref:Uncharacterized protein n=1 Tax=Opisthorchis viverrini TaxID=6198 RepID=A0A1S8WQ97_OPIVI|nr:hypothetical protein X801_07775 [Opisthorchis viverrini]
MVENQLNKKGDPVSRPISLETACEFKLYFLTYQIEYKFEPGFSGSSQISLKLDFHLTWLLIERTGKTMVEQNDGLYLAAIQSPTEKLPPRYPKSLSPFVVIPPVYIRLFRKYGLNQAG